MTGRVSYFLLLRAACAACLLAAALGAVAQSTGKQRPTARSSGAPPGRTVYTGPYRAAGYVGTAKYQYAVVEGDTLRDGGFQMRGAALPALVRAGDTAFAFRGSFRDDVPSDLWRFEFGAYRPAGSARVEGFEYRVDVDGEHTQTSGAVKRGRLDGKWNAETRRVEASQATATVFRSAFTFAAGVPQQTFQLSGGEASLLGRVKRDGLAHDTWTLFAEAGEGEEWRFEDGWLRAISGASGDVADAVPVFDADLAAGALVPLDADYVRLVSLWLDLQGRPLDLAGDPAVALIIASAALHREIAEVLGALGGSAVDPAVRVRIPSLPLAPGEFARLDSIHARLLRVDAVARALDETTSLRVAETTVEEAAFLRALLREVDAELLAPVRALDSVYQADLLELLPRERYYARLWPDGTAPAALTVAFEAPDGPRTRTYAPLGARTFDIAGGGLPAISALSAYALATVDSAREALGITREAVERRQAITALDDRLLIDFYRLDSLAEVHRDRLPEEYGLAEVRRVARRELRAYAALDDDAPGRLEAEVALIRCLEDLFALGVRLVDLPDRAAEVEDLYVDEVWNNFTVTLMEETVKRRVIEAYTDRLLPYFLDEVNGTLDCANAGRIAAQLDALNERMVQLRSTDTEDLERKLKRVDNPRKILDLFEVSPES